LDQEEFIQLVTKHSGIIHKILYLYVDDPDDKNDLKQEILVQAWSAIGRFKSQSTFSTWLYRVALNTVLTFQKKAERMPISRGESVLNEMESKINSEHPQSERLFRAIKTLNDIDKTIITLHLEDYNHEEIAEITGLSKNNITVKLHRIKKHISTLLKGGNNG
jgi:RNA polymerase sigma-70 factor, ECF subfamily